MASGAARVGCRAVRRARDGGVIEVGGPDSTARAVSVIVSRRVEPRDAAKLRLPDEPVIVFADWLSPRDRALLRTRGASDVAGPGDGDGRAHGYGH